MGWPAPTMISIQQRLSTYSYYVLFHKWGAVMAWTFGNSPLLRGILGIALWFPLIISRSFGLRSYDPDSSFRFPISIWHELSLFNHKLHLWWMLDNQNKSTGKIIRGNQREEAHSLEQEAVWRFLGLSPWSSDNVFWSLSECKWMTSSNHRQFVTAQVI